MVLISRGKSWSTMNCSGIWAELPPSRGCWLKQKHSVLWKYSAALEGEMLGYSRDSFDRDLHGGFSRGTGPWASQQRKSEKTDT